MLPAITMSGNQALQKSGKEKGSMPTLPSALSLTRHRYGPRNHDEAHDKGKLPSRLGPSTTGHEVLRH